MTRITFPAGTPIRCSRCGEKGAAPRAFDANRENSRSWRMSGMMINPACGHPDGHWVFFTDLFNASPTGSGRHSVVRQAHDLSDGTLATLTGERKYDAIQEIQTKFLTFCAENWAKFTRWQDAWRAFEDTDANTWTPHEDNVCPDCGSDKPDWRSYCDATAAHYGG